MTSHPPVFDSCDGLSANRSCANDASLYMPLRRMLAADGKLGIYGINDLQTALRANPPGLSLDEIEKLREGRA